MRGFLRAIWKLSQQKTSLQAFLARFYSFSSRNSRRICGQRNTVLVDRVFLKQTKLLIMGDNNMVTIGGGSRITRTKIVLIGSNHVLSIGENCIYKSGQIWLEDNNCQIVIGKDTTVEGALIKAVEPGSNIYIGTDCMLGDHVEVRTSDMHSILDASTGNRINPAANVVIGNHVWLGAHVRVLKGATIGDHCVVGTDAVVTQEIPQHCMAVGIPARVIRENVTWIRERLSAIAISKFEP